MTETKYDPEEVYDFKNWYEPPTFGILSNSSVSYDENSYEVIIRFVRKDDFFRRKTYKTDRNDYVKIACNNYRRNSHMGIKFENIKIENYHVSIEASSGESVMIKYQHEDMEYEILVPISVAIWVSKFTPKLSFLEKMSNDTDADQDIYYEIFTEFCRRSHWYINNNTMHRLTDESLFPFTQRVINFVNDIANRYVKLKSPISHKKKISTIIKTIKVFNDGVKKLDGLVKNTKVVKNNHDQAEFNGTPLVYNGFKKLHDGISLQQFHESIETLICTYHIFGFNARFITKIYNPIKRVYLTKADIKEAFSLMNMEEVISS